jgi:hypothetical protein
MPRAVGNDDADEEYLGRGARRLGRGRGTDARGAAARGAAAAGRGAGRGCGRGQAVDTVADALPPFMAQEDDSDDLDPPAADELADDFLPTYFDELDKASAGITKYEALVLKGRNQVKSKAYTDKANAGLKRYKTQFAAASALIKERRAELRRQAAEAARKAKKPAKGLGRHAADFSDRK